MPHVFHDLYKQVFMIDADHYVSSILSAIQCPTVNFDKKSNVRHTFSQQEWLLQSTDNDKQVLYIHFMLKENWTLHIRMRKTCQK